MKKRYYLSMFSLFPICLLFDSVYFIYHQSVNIFFTLGFIHFFLFVVFNFIGIYFIYKPIEDSFLVGEFSSKATKRIVYISWYSTLWIFCLGFIYLLISLIPLYFLPYTFQNPADFVIDKIPEELLFYSIVPGITYIYVLFPAFIGHFIINDFKLDLKKYVSTQFGVNFPEGKKYIAQTLFFVFLFLVVLPSLLTILELQIAFQTKDKYQQFTSLSPVETVMIDRFVVFVGMILSFVLITRAFTKPIHSLLKAISKVREGDLSTQAAIISEDEIGVLTKQFNEMIQGLREREIIRDTFGKYVTKDIANVILNQQIKLEGEIRTCTILVTDIANYTSISEQLSPTEIVQMLNEYFSILVKIIQSHNGVVNKFIGDSIFAMFNVPLDDPDHAQNAIQAAIEIHKITSSKKFGKDRLLSTRMGINTGVVVAGNLGSSDRMEYTVIGDDVNIAARLEQLNKENNTNILIGDNTYQLVKEKISCRLLGNFQLKGKENTIPVYVVDI